MKIVSNIHLIIFISFYINIASAYDNLLFTNNYVHRVLDIENGLPQNSVQAIVQTEDGYIWMGTQEGLVRYDGINFKVFDNSNQSLFATNDIRSLLTDSKGNLWIGTWGGGLLSYKKGVFKVYSKKQGLSNTQVWGLFEDNRGRIWCGTDGGGANVLENDKFKSFNTENGLSHNVVYVINQDNSGNMWFGTRGGGLSILKDGKFLNYNTNNGLSSNHIWSFLKDSQGNMWVGTFQGGLLVYKNGEFKRYNKEAVYDSMWVIFEDSNKNIWIGTEGGGVSLLKNNKVSHFTKNNGLSNNIIMSMTEDREGNLWIGTNGGGVNILSKSKFRTFSAENGLSQDHVNSLYEDSSGSLWVATIDGLNIIKGSNIKIFNKDNGFINTYFTSIVEDKNGVIWVGTNGGGLYNYSDNVFTRVNIEETATNKKINFLYKDSKENIWFGLRRGGIEVWENGKFNKSYNRKNGLPSDRTSFVLEDKEGIYWIGTDGHGLVRFDGDKFRVYSTKDGLSKKMVLTGFQDSEGYLWIGTYSGGLNLFKNQKFYPITVKDGLFDSTVFQILEDASNNLWFCSNKGIFAANRLELLKFTEGKIKRINSKSYDKSDGMKARECRGGFQPAGIKSKSGKLYFPTIKGFSEIDPENMLINKVIPPVYIEKVISDDKELDKKRSLNILPGTSRIEFHYTGLSFKDPKKVNFKYKLVGFDKDWIDAKARRIAYYTNIAPGKYRFEVIASNNDGVWNQKGDKVEFRLLPHFYETSWFYFIIVICAILFFLILYKWREKQIRKIVSAESAIIRQEKLAQVGQMMGDLAHELKNIHGSAVTGFSLTKELATDLLSGFSELHLKWDMLVNSLFVDDKISWNKQKDRLKILLPPEGSSNIMKDQLEDLAQVFIKLNLEDEVLVEIWENLCQIDEDNLVVLNSLINMSHFVSMMHQSAKSAENLMLSVLDHIRKDREDFDNPISQAISSCFSLVNKKYQKANISFSISVPGALENFMVNHQFNQIILNLLINAHDSLIENNNSTRENKVNINVKRKDKYIITEVCDNGEGIPSNIINKIFERNYSTKGLKGSGLGLFVSKKLAEMNEGTIDVKSETGKTVFSIALPDKNS